MSPLDWDSNVVLLSGSMMFDWGKVAYSNFIQFLVVFLSHIHVSIYIYRYVSIDLPWSLLKTSTSRYDNDRLSMYIFWGLGLRVSSLEFGVRFWDLEDLFFLHLWFSYSLKLNILLFNNDFLDSITINIPW